MVTVDTDNVIPLQTGPAAEPQPGPGARPKDPTNATRQRRHRAKRKTRRTVTVTAATTPTTEAISPNFGGNKKPNEIKAGVTVHAAPPLVPDTVAHVTSERHGCGITIAALTAALALATVSGGFSITGMTAVFVGAYWPVIAMGIALEIGKLSAVAWLGHQHGRASWRLRAALTILVAVLIGLNAVGCYGFLAKAHIGHAVAGETAVASRAADVDARLAVQAGIVADLDRRIHQIDAAIETATQRGRTGAAMRLADDQRKARADLAGQRAREAKTVADIQIEKARVDGDRKVADADLGPVRYLATLLGAGDQDVLRYFILVVSMLLDPAAVLLLLAATRR